jgi:hypothetical protein
MHAAAFKLQITPPLGTRMAGYRARRDGATVVHDELFARCLAFASGDERHAVLSLDVMGVGVEWVTELRRRVQRSLGLDGSRLLVATTHTHSAQGGLFSYEGAVGEALGTMMGDGTAGHDAEGYEQLLLQCESALENAFARLEPASFAVAEGRVDGVAANRVWFERPADPSCVVLTVRDSRRKLLGLLAHFNCHPTTLGEADTGISGDFPGVAMGIAEQELGGTALFLNGALGDTSTRLTRREQSYAEVLRFGRALGDEVVALAGRAEPVEGGPVSAATRVVELAPRRPEWLARIEQRVEALAGGGGAGSPEVARQLLTAREGVESAARAADALAGLDSVPVQLQALAFGSALTLVGVPGELFSDAQRTLAVTLPDVTARIVAPANGYMGYFPSAEAYDEGGYEVGVSLVDRGAAEVLTEAAIDLVTVTEPTAGGEPRWS